MPLLGDRVHSAEYHTFPNPWCLQFYSVIKHLGFGGDVSSRRRFHFREKNASPRGQGTQLSTIPSQ